MPIHFMKKTIIRALLIILLIADMAFIFSNSAQSSATSSTTSQGVTEIVAPVVVPNYDTLDEAGKKQAVANLDGIVREAAHLLQFVPLGFSLYLLLSTFESKERLRRYRIPITFGFGLMYAVSDEIHQLLSPGRSFQLFDIFMDACGVTVGCIGGIILLLIITTVNKKRNKKSE